MFKCTLEEGELDEEYIGLYINGLMIMDPIYGQIPYNCCLSNALKLKLEHNPKICFIDMKQATGKVITKHIIMPAEVIPASRVKAWCAQLLLMIHRLLKVLKKVVEERTEWSMVGKRMILVSMWVLIERIELIVLHPYIFVPIVACLWNT